jgi:hypothetical protein
VPSAPECFTNSHIGRSVNFFFDLQKSPSIQLLSLHQYSLFKCICQEVDELHIRNQGGGFFRVAYAGGIKPPKDLGDADGICDWLDQRKMIDMEWLKVKDMMESARHLEMAVKGGDDVDD